MKLFALVWISLAVGVALGWSFHAMLRRDDAYQLNPEGERERDRRDVEAFLADLGRRAG